MSNTIYREVLTVANNVYKQKTLFATVKALLFFGMRI